MTTLRIGAELARIVRTVEKSAAKGNSRPVLAGIYATVRGDRLTLATADGFRLSTAAATLDAPAAPAAILVRAGRACLQPDLALVPIQYACRGYDCCDVM